MSDYADYEFVPGTVHLVDTEGGLHVKKNGKSNIILHPPPSNNPNDPLRWSQKKKKVQFIILFWVATFLAITVNWYGPVYTTFTIDFNCTYQDLNIAAAFCFLFLGLGCLFLQPTALKLGRRFVYLVCTVLMIVANIIGSRATKVQHLWASTIISGFAAAPCDSLVEISTTDVFFQHERASFLSWFIMALYVGSYIGPTITGLIADHIGWRWCFYLQVILFAITLVIVFFFSEDTTFRREENGEDALEEDILEQIRSRTETLTKTGDEDAKDLVESKLDEVNSDIDSVDFTIPLRTYRQKIKLWETEYNDQRSWFCIFYRPFMLITFPAVLWGGLVYGAQMMWLSLLATTQSLIYAAPPYGWSDSIVGLTNLAPLIGSIVGMFYGGAMVDYLTIYLSKRNRGIMEPEFRLYAMIVPTILNAAGLLAYGLTSQTAQPWPISVVLGQGFLGFAMSASGPICLTYAIDSYGKLASEAMVLMLFIRNMIGMGFTFAISPWLDRNGLTVTTWIMFMLSIVINGSFIFMIIFGKKFRKWTAGTYAKYSDPTYGEFRKK